MTHLLALIKLGNASGRGQLGGDRRQLGDAMLGLRAFDGSK
jgi:hypothetical protein